MTEKREIPLFPLRIVMFPRGRFDLQIFEKRYIDLIRDCLRTDSGFGICLLKTGEETFQENSEQKIYSAGTYSRIVDWDQLENGLLGITVEGAEKFFVSNCWKADNDVLHAEVEFSEIEFVGNENIPLEDQFIGLSDLLHNLESHPLVEKKNLIIDYDNLWDLGWRLSELIPIDVNEKQKLLEINDPWERINNIEKLVADLANNT